ncbi:hypothetical protein PENSPDRAFT_549342, partial [Peniophora sp. CONT]
SDGESAVRAAEEREQQRARGAQRGPENMTLKHWHPPQAVVQPATGDRWRFNCRWCKASHTVPRKVPADQTFESEPVKPSLSNLATHTRQHRAQIDAAEAGDGDDGQSPDKPCATDIQSKSRAMMDAFVKEGVLHPASNPTTTSFTRVFVGWVLGDALPWTTGESLNLGRLFRHVQVTYGLPTDTTVLALDNVASNDVLCRTLAGLLMRRYGIVFNPENAQIHCLAHVVNLVVQKIMNVAGEVMDDPDIRDYYDLFFKHLNFHFNVDDDEDLQAWEEEEYD